MSSFGFDTAIKNITRQKKTALRKCMAAAQKEFKENFDTESVDSEAWEPVVRGYPPPILDVSGELKAQTTSRGNVVILTDSAVLTVDPKDDRGRGYAAYHDEGTPNMPQREFIKQTDELQAVQEEIILNTIDNAFLK